MGPAGVTTVWRVACDFVQQLQGAYSSGEASGRACRLMPVLSSIREWWLASN
jgi:hypothetical protein